MTNSKSVERRLERHIKLLYLVHLLVVLILLYQVFVATLSSHTSLVLEPSGTRVHGLVLKLLLS